MSETTRLLDDLVGALADGDRAALLAALGDTPVALRDGAGWRTLTGGERAAALDPVLAAFDDLAVTVVSRRANPASSLASMVVSARHVGAFAGAEPTGHRVRMTLDAVAVASAQGEGGVARLELTPDHRGLMSQLADSGDTLGLASAMVAAVRENDGRQSTQWQVPEAAPVPAVAGHRKPGRRRAAVLVGAIALVALAAVVGWRALAVPPPPPIAAVGTTVAPAPSASSSPSPSVTASPSPTRSAVPVIRTAQPSARPTVQAGRQLVLTSDVLFALGSSDLTPSARRALLRLADQIREAEVEGVVQVNGYTDDVGSPADNLALSRARALAVARVLQPALGGVPVSLQPQGFGEASAVASNSTDAGRAKNRRVTIVLPKG